MQQRSEGTRARIRAAALEQFSLHGYDAAGVALICQAAGISKGAFYHHYPSKHAVFFDLLQTWLASLDSQMDRILSSTQDISGAFSEMAGLLSGVFSEAGGRLPMFLEFWTQSSRDPHIWQATVAPYRRYGERFAELVQRGVEQGVFREVDAAATSRVILALSTGLLLSSLLDPDGAAWDQVAREGMQVILNGLLIGKI